MRPGERLNGITHLVGAALALVGLGVLIALVVPTMSALRIVAFSVYGLTLFFMYLASTLYHSLIGRAKEIFHRLDHIGIFLLIAGTYTPFATVMLGGAWGWSLFAAVWALAAAGIIFETTLKDRARPISSVLYLVMGWLAVLAIRPLIDALDLGTLAWILAGGILYTAGFGVMMVKSLRLRHEIWHFFVLGGSACHFVAIVLYLA